VLRLNGAGPQFMIDGEAVVPGEPSFSHQFQNKNFPTSKAKTLTHATVTLINVTDSITPTARSRPLSSGQSNQRFIAVSLNQVDRRSMAG
jgi:hypothetical protein